MTAKINGVCLSNNRRIVQYIMEQLDSCELDYIAVFFLYVFSNARIAVNLQ